LNLVSKFHIHPLFWLLTGLAIVTAHFKELMMLFFIILVHEMGHVVSAHFFSWRIKRIQLLPFGGVAEMEEHGNRPLKEELIVTLAGPLQHIWLVGVAYFLQMSGVISQETFELFLFHNVIIFCFNLLPIWPLDGGKLLFLLLSLKYSFFKSHRLTLILSTIAVVLFISSIFMYQPTQLNLWIVISFLIFSIIMEWRQRHFVFMRFLLERYYGKQSTFKTLKPIIVDDHQKIHQVLLLFHRGYKHPIIINKEGNHQIPIDENELLHAYFSEKKTTETIGEVFYSY
jgi:stage IV sporulation protein FB